MDQLFHILQCFLVVSFVVFSTVYSLPLQLEMGSLKSYGWYQTGNTIELSIAGLNIKYQGNSLLEEY